MASTPRLSRRLTLERRVTVPDGAGGETSGWAALGVLWAELKPLGGKEIRAAAREGPRITHRVSVRSAPDGSPRMPEASQRFRLGARVFDIHAVARPHLADGFVTCWCEEGPYA
jgi:SPP1 family predicted phage head-tail adaptor